VRNADTLWGNIRRMWVGPAVALFFYFYLIYLSPVRMVMALPILLLWIISPVVSWMISQPLQFSLHNLSGEQRMFLRRTARRTWAFFDTFVTEADNWLPPDNFQEHPVATIAHRTSPTNMGMALLANLTAYDFGYISQQQLLIRCSNTLTTMGEMERFQGHLYNWYDTQTLDPLYPRYVSTVDSGNLAGHLITLKQGLAGLKHAPVVNPRLFEGLLDTLLVANADKKNPHREKLQAIKKYMEQSIAEVPHTWSATRVLLLDWTTVLAALPAAETPTEAETETPVHEYLYWMDALKLQLADALNDLEEMIPWLSLAAIPASYIELQELDRIVNLAQLTEAPDRWLPLMAQYAQQETNPENKAWLQSADMLIREAGTRAVQRLQSIVAAEAQCNELADMEYRFLYDHSKHLLSIGYNVEEHQRDASYYDLLASEVRLGIFVAISQGKLPQESWFSLGRLLTNTTTDPVLVSWSGSMFEYLMPQLVMPAYENTLLYQTNKSTVKRQIEYARQRNIPWGISESGYNMVDAALNYQYRAFGVPGLGLKRGLAEDLVIAPYATMMALMVTPDEACQNLQQLDKEGFQGLYGFYEAVDYTASRVPRGQSYVTIRSFMAHHQGMGFLSLSYLLLNQPMQQRFESEPQFQATLLLLQERVPRATIFYSHTPEVSDTHTSVIDPQIRVINTPFTPIPEVQLLSNSKYQVMVTNSGGGYSRWRDIALTRWREDAVYDNWGLFCYIKDMDSGSYWSNTYQPTQQQAKNYEAIFSQGHAEFRRKDNSLITRTEVVVSPEDDVETRRVKITNRSQSHKIVEVTSYAEVVLTAIAADIAHPAFSNLFVQTEILRDQHAILCSRRPRSAHEAPPSMFHLMSVTGADIEAVGYETDRMQFIGRGNSIAHPQAMNNNVDLSGSEGSVLDPIVAIRYRIVIKPNHTATIDMVLGIGETREICLALLRKYQDKHLKNRAFELSWTHSQVMLRQINATEADAQLYGRMAGSILFPNPALRAEPATINSNYRGQSGLWSYSISGDLPIVLLRVQDSENIEIVKQMVQAHAYWRLKGLAVDLVIWNEDHGSYRQLLQDQILSLVTAVGGGYGSDRPGSVFVRSADQISNEDRILFQTVARLIIDDNKGPLSEQVNRKLATKALPPALNPPHRFIPQPLSVPVNHRQLIFSNGIGGFSADGREYVITTSREQHTPAPWSNVIANPSFGSVISESGSAYTWGENAHSFRLTPWNNDPVTDSGGEAFYIRDEDNGHFWSPCPFPAASKMPYTTRHGFGYSIFEHLEDGIHSDMTVFADIKESMKYVVIRVRNTSGKPRKLSLTGYVEWVLNDIKAKSGMHIVTEHELDSGAVFARNRYNSAFAERVAFFHADTAAGNSHTCDRIEFIGRNGSIKKPAALGRTRLSGRHGAALDPCAAIQVPFSLQEGQNRTIVFRLGKGENTADARRMVNELKGIEAADQALVRVKAFWEETLQAVQVETPDRTLNILANGWLTYQTLASRLWARSGYYQSGGAFGFRDQLQDVMSLLHSQPQLAREQILRCASRQFKEGDVQHWWHPPTGRGVRTRCSDDYLWLPFATARYVTTTGDDRILDELVHFLDGRLLNADEESYYDLPNTLDQSASLYEHGKAAIRHGLQFGVHGLPLIGSGDWNDGMDSVGIKGKGESVWLGFFLYDVLRRFEPLARLQEDEAFATECTEAAAQLQAHIEEHAWDGNWYRRAYFDDGTPLGSSGNEECRIDSISQSWAVLSGAGNKERAQRAMQAVDQHLVRRDIGLIQLLDPPFDKSQPNPGYIKGYVPGVRENGGQYTHAAIWTIMAFAALGDNERVWELFSLINPINHGSSARAIKTYKVEPYVAAADVYAVSPHNGRGGWTWYTGSAGWMYHFILESLLGLRLEGNRLSLNPCVPAEWPSFKIRYRFGATLYHIHVAQTHTGVETTRISLDGTALPDDIILLQDDGQPHQVEVLLPLKSRGKLAAIAE
jgi:cellobiose phosphorylase